MHQELLLTSVSLFDILSQIPELSGCKIDVSDTGTSISIKIDDNAYVVKSSSNDIVSAPESVVQDVSEIVDTEYSKSDSSENIESGVLKEIVKTLAVGGLVRLSAKLLSK